MSDRFRTSVIAAFALMAICIGSVAQNTVEFTVAALNVDGLPAKILFWDVNPDGPGSDGTKEISQGLSKKNYDIIAVSEDFNYHGSLMSYISDNYDAGTHRGSISVGDFGYPFDTDGLDLIWKKDINVSDESWTRWEHYYGTTSDGNDGLIKKGYRHYVAHFGNDIDIDIYIMHMDAETSEGDNQARETQWTQLASAILANAAHRPVIVMGDTNSRYTRDPIQRLFVNRIETTGSYTVRDAWVEKCKGNTYPRLGTNDLIVGDLGYRQGEIVDKILYLNPIYGLKLKCKSFLVDTGFTREDGTPLADHFPVVAKFTTEGQYRHADKQWQWTDYSEEDKAAYQRYYKIFERALPYLDYSLPQESKQLLAELLQMPASMNDTQVATILENFFVELEQWLSTDFTASDMTSRIANPSFELGARLQSGNVQGWTVASDVDEAFTSTLVDGTEGAAVRSFNPHDGECVFNTWGGWPLDGFFCRQDISITPGWYRLEATVASDGGNRVNLYFDGVMMESEPMYDRASGQRVSLIVYHKNGKGSIGLFSPTWFEADDFRLTKYTAIPSSIDEADASSLNNASGHPFIYSMSGQRLPNMRRGINIVRVSDGSVRKIVR